MGKEQIQKFSLEIVEQSQSTTEEILTEIKSLLDYANKYLDEVKYQNMRELRYNELYDVQYALNNFYESKSESESESESETKFYYSSDMFAIFFHAAKGKNEVIPALEYFLDREDLGSTFGKWCLDLLDYMVERTALKSYYDLWEKSMIFEPTIECLGILDSDLKCFFKILKSLEENEHITLPEYGKNLRNFGNEVYKVYFSYFPYINDQVYIKALFQDPYLYNIAISTILDTIDPVLLIAASIYWEEQGLIEAKNILRNKDIYSKSTTEYSLFDLKDFMEDLSSGAKSQDNDPNQLFWMNIIDVLSELINENKISKNYLSLAIDKIKENNNQMTLQNSTGFRSKIEAPNSDFYSDIIRSFKAFKIGSPKL